ncbi:MAG: (Fe-S)-binding protein [Candidatus Baltobacteraceae bacterium]
MIEDIYNQCVRCGLCLPTCPTYLETMTETSSPRGRISLIKAVDEGRLAVLSPGFVHQMSECLDCRACEAVCPSGVQYGQLVEDARAKVARAVAPTASAKATFVRRSALGLFNNLGTLRFAATLLRFYQRSGLQSLARGSGLLRALGLDQMEAQSPNISDRYFVPRDQRYEVENPKLTAFLHAGCVMQVAFAGVNEATVRVLNRAGCSVVVPSGQGCCGALAIHAGEPGQTRALAKRNIAAFEESGADLYVINAAGCGSTLKEYRELFAADEVWRTRAAAFSERVRDITELLSQVGLGTKLAAIEATVTYQEPCHLAHAQRITAQPRALLAMIPGLTLIEMNESSVCCGSAGIYNLTEPAMAKRLQKRKIDNTIATKAQIVVTANPGCALQLSSGLRSAGSSIQVKHIVELLDEAGS